MTLNLSDPSVGKVVLKPISWQVFVFFWKSSLYCLKRGETSSRVTRNFSLSSACQKSCKICSAHPGSHLSFFITKAAIAECGRRVKWVTLAKSLPRPKAWGVPFHNLVKPSIFEDKLDFSTNLNNCLIEFYLSICFLIKNCYRECKRV